MKRFRAKILVRELKEHGDRCAVHHMTFSPLPEVYHKAMEKQQKEIFELWWSTWIEPKLDELESILND